jgi:hypothetical protein
MKSMNVWIQDAVQTNCFDRKKDHAKSSISMCLPTEMVIHSPTVMPVENSSESDFFCNTLSFSISQQHT